MGSIQCGPFYQKRFLLILFLCQSHCSASQRVKILAPIFGL